MCLSSKKYLIIDSVKITHVWTFFRLSEGKMLVCVRVSESERERERDLLIVR